MAIYLDHAATTPVHPTVAKTFADVMTTIPGNPSSIHQMGREARKVLDDARKVLAQSIHAKPIEIMFTSGGTEANNTALFGAAEVQKHKGNHIITTDIEHHAVLNTCKQLEARGFEVTYLPVNADGQITVEQVQDALTDQTIVVSIMYGNNEVGTVQPIEEIGALLRNHQAIFHTDAVQAYGVVPLNVETLGVDLLSVSAHKLNGPKGIGFLYIKEHIVIPSLLFGGEQERKRRAGTENIPAIVAFAKAVELAHEALEQNVNAYQQYEQILQSTLVAEEIDFTIHAKNVDRLPHIVNISFPGTDIESFLVNLDMAGVYVSSGSACTAGSLDPSHVLTAMFGKGAPALRNSVRFSFGYGLDEEQVKRAAIETAKIIKRVV